MKFLLLIIGCLVFTNCQLYNRTDYCLNYDINFDLRTELVFGDWYPVSVDTNVRYNYDCHKLTITKLGTKEALVNVLNMSTNSFITFNSIQSKRINSFISYLDGIRSLCTVIDTDYTSYLVAIQCVESANWRNYHAVILSRTMTLPDDLIERLQNMIVEKFNWNFEFKTVEFSNCS
jgi:hypothetical protein